MTSTTRRDWLFLGCQVAHDWKSIGGCNAACDPLCGCSVPVHKCTQCGDCDYGDNGEATEIRKKCAESRGAA